MTKNWLCFRVKFVDYWFLIPELTIYYSWIDYLLFMNWLFIIHELTIYYSWIDYLLFMNWLFIIHELTIYNSFTESLRTITKPLKPYISRRHLKMTTCCVLNKYWTAKETSYEYKISTWPFTYRMFWKPLKSHSIPCRIFRHSHDSEC